MKRVLLVLLTLLLSLPALALDRAQPRFQIVVQNPQSRVQTTFGMTRIHTKAANIRVAWLPLLAPLPYSYPRTTQEVPNPLVMSGTEIPQRPHSAAHAVVTVRR